MLRIPSVVRDHYQHVQAIEALGLKLAAGAWSGVDPRRLARSWIPVVENDLTPAVTELQLRAATAGATYSARTLAAQGAYVAPAAFVDPAAFAGIAPDGRSLSSLLRTPLIITTAALRSGAEPVVALAAGRHALDRIVVTVTADTARTAAGADIVTRAGVGYTRMLNPPSCDRCVILAGKWFQWNAGFRRHPRCDCVHVASRAGSRDAALAEGLIADPYEAFWQMSEADQDRVFGRANAAAIRDGADMPQVVNSLRGRRVTGMDSAGRRRYGASFTTEGTTRHGHAFGGLAQGQRRMTPEGIYATSRTREEALDALRTHGYLLRGGQSPEGLLRGPGLGLGSTTAAEQRLAAASRRYELALSGADPYSQRYRPVSPAALARAESEFHRWLATGGQIYTS